MRTFFKQKTDRVPEFLAFVREQECFCCGAPPPSDPSHFGGRTHGGGMGLKGSDYCVAPLCRACHQVWHSHGRLPLPGGIRTLQDLDAPVRTFDPQMSRLLHTEANRDALAAYVESLGAF